MRRENSWDSRGIKAPLAKGSTPNSHMFERLNRERWARFTACTTHLGAPSKLRFCNWLQNNDHAARLSAPIPGWFASTSARATGGQTLLPIALICSAIVSGRVTGLPRMIFVTSGSST